MTSTPLRREVLRLVIAIIVVDALAVAVYLLADIRQQPPTTRFWFTLIWTLLVLAIVLTGLRRIRMIRAGRHRRVDSHHSTGEDRAQE